MEQATELEQQQPPSPSSSAHKRARSPAEQRKPSPVLQKVPKLEDQAGIVVDELLLLEPSNENSASSTTITTRIETKKQDVVARTVILLPLARTIREFVAAPTRYRPRPEWFPSPSFAGPDQRQQDTSPMTQVNSSSSNSARRNEAIEGEVEDEDMQDVSDGDEGEIFTDDAVAESGGGNASLSSIGESTSTKRPSRQQVLFGEDMDTSLLFAIRHNSEDAALAILEGSVVHAASNTSIEEGGNEEQGNDSDDAHVLPVPEDPNVSKSHLVTARTLSNPPTNTTGSTTPLSSMSNSRGITPLIVASQKGMERLVQVLLERHHADPRREVTHSGSTALLQAAHFGHASICQLLLQRGAPVDCANLKNTTPLMRASQEGHLEVCRLLLEAGANVVRTNNEQMSALMLASQRGHAKVVSCLIEYKAPLDSMTAQKSTSLMLATKRHHVDVVRILLTEGCQLMVKDHRGRSAYDMAKRRSNSSNNNNTNNTNNNNHAQNNASVETQRSNAQLVELLSKSYHQVDLMRQACRKRRNFEMVRIYNLLQQERAFVPLDRGQSNQSIHSDAVKELIRRTGSIASSSRSFSSTSRIALIGTMSLLPAPCMEVVASYIPLPFLWEKQIDMIMDRMRFDVDSGVEFSLDVIDEILEEGGFLHACDEAGVMPPAHYSSWGSDWKRNRGTRSVEDSNSRASDAAVAGGMSSPMARMFGYPHPVSATTNNNSRRARPFATLPGLPHFIRRMPPTPSGNATIASSTGATVGMMTDSDSILSLEEDVHPVEHRRSICYLTLLAHRGGPSRLGQVLAGPSYRMPDQIIESLITMNDIQSLSRRLGTSGGVKFDESIGAALVFVASNLRNWYLHQHHQEPSTLAVTRYHVHNASFH